MKNKLHVVVVELANGGGLIHFDYQLCTALANEGVDVTLITGTEYELGNLPHNFTVNKMLHLWEKFDPQSMQSLLSIPWKRRLKKTFLTLRRAIRAVRVLLAWIQLTLYLTRVKPDRILFSKIEYALDAIFIAYLGRRGLVLSQVCHEFEARESHDRFSRLFLRLDTNAYTQFSAIFFLAQESRHRFLSLYPSIPEINTHVISHGNSSWLLTFEPTSSVSQSMKKYNLRDDDRVVLFFGLLSPSKGLDDLVEAFSLVIQSCKAKLLIAGYPTKHIDLEALRARIVELNIMEHVIFDLRYIPLGEIGSIMNLATVVVYPYRSSTQSGSLQAAYTFGKPVIVSAVGGLPEAVEDGKNGFLISPQNPKELADKITMLVNTPELAKKMGQYSSYLSETRFSWRSIARKIIMTFEDLLAKNER